MPRIPGVSTASPIRGQIQNIENKFTGGLITEASGLNFPENACTATNNCIFDLIGTVQRRPGMNFEIGGTNQTIASSSTQAKSTFLWQNVQGDGTVNFAVAQIGASLYFWNLLAGQPTTQNFLQSLVMTPIPGAPAVGTAVAQFAAGYGYLFVAHPSCDPIAINYSNGVFTVTTIDIQIRDQAGIPEPGVPVTTRPITLTNEHNYNLLNQGWLEGNPWASEVTTGAVSFVIGVPQNFQINTGLTIPNGTIVIVNYFLWAPGGGPTNVVNNAASGTVTGYNSGSGVVTVNFYYVSAKVSGASYTLGTASPNSALIIQPVNVGYINTWVANIGNYPSNADVWWRFKDSTGAFNPLLTSIGNVSLPSAQAPQGKFIFEAFNQNRIGVSGIQNLTPIVTTARPSAIAYFQGRVWYSGVNAVQPATGDANYYSWTQNIYFSQISVDANDVSTFGQCYQAEDPTDQNLFDLLPTDGGVIRIADCGSIVKLFPIQGALIVFATNGIWTITGNTGLGFTANDYSINKLSAIRCVSGTSFVDVLGFPMWWTQEGVYTIRIDVTAGGLRVDSITDTTIKTFYQSIPLQSKAFAVGVYNPLKFTVTFLYSSTAPVVSTSYLLLETTGKFLLETSGGFLLEPATDSAYVFDSALTFNTITGAWYPWSFGNNARVHGVFVSPYGPQTDVANSPQGHVNNYLTSYKSGSNDLYTFSQTWDNTSWLDWKAKDGVGQNYVSYYECGYRVHGEGAKRFQANYVFMYSNNSTPTQYTLQGFWNFARQAVQYTTDYQGIVPGLYILMEDGTDQILTETGGVVLLESDANVQAPQTSVQTFVHDGQSSDYAWRRIKLRGNGMVAQFLVSSVQGQPFHNVGWSIFETINAGV